MRKFGTGGDFGIMARISIITVADGDKISLRNFTMTLIRL